MSKKISVLTNAACRDDLGSLNHRTLMRRVAALGHFYCRVAKVSQAVIESTFVSGLQRVLGECFYVQ